MRRAFLTVGPRDGCVMAHGSGIWAHTVKRTEAALSFLDNSFLDNLRPLQIAKIAEKLTKKLNFSTNLVIEEKTSTSLLLINTQGLSRSHHASRHQYTDLWTSQVASTHGQNWRAHTHDRFATAIMA